MQKLLRAYKAINLLSLDVAIGAVCCSAWLAGAMKVQVDFIVFTVLGIAVWIIYTIDRLLDVSRIKNEPSTERHRFHKQHFTILEIAVLLSGLVVAAMVFTLPAPVIKAGAVLSGLVLVHLLLNRYMIYVKELGIAVLYTAGILLPSVSIGGTQGLLNRWPLIVGFFLTVLVNLVLFSWCEREFDQRDNTKSIATTAGAGATEVMIRILFGAQLIVVIIVLTRSWPTAVVLMIMNGILWLLFQKKNLSENYDGHRLLGDAIFLIPGILLPLII